jgi:hypothetical protein
MTGTPPRNAASWAAKVDRLHVADDVRHGYNVEGRRVAGPQQGFGRLWQRTSLVRLPEAVTPEALVADWRANFGHYWPRISRFHGRAGSIEPGDVAPLTAGPVTTGILVLYADETSFTFLTPEGHLFAGMITFSATTVDGGTCARIDILLRPSDPVVEAAWFLIRPAEDRFWAGTLRNLAAAHGVPRARVEQTTTLVDGRRLWRNWTNLFRNATIRMAWHTVSAPVAERRRRR